MFFVSFFLSQTRPRRKRVAPPTADSITPPPPPRSTAPRSAHPPAPQTSWAGTQVSGAAGPQVASAPAAGSQVAGAPAEVVREVRQIADGKEEVLTPTPGRGEGKAGPAPTADLLEVRFVVSFLHALSFCQSVMALMRCCGCARLQAAHLLVNMFESPTPASPSKRGRGDVFGDSPGSSAVGHPLSFMPLLIVAWISPVVARSRWNCVSCGCFVYSRLRSMGHIAPFPQHVRVEIVTMLLLMLCGRDTAYRPLILALAPPLVDAADGSRGHALTPLETAGDGGVARKTPTLKASLRSWESPKLCDWTCYLVRPWNLSVSPRDLPSMLPFQLCVIPFWVDLPIGFAHALVDTFGGVRVGVGGL